MPIHHRHAARGRGRMALWADLLDEVRQGGLLHGIIQSEVERRARTARLRTRRKGKRAGSQRAALCNDSHRGNHLLKPQSHFTVMSFRGAMQRPLRRRNWHSTYASVELVSRATVATRSIEVSPDPRAATVVVQRPRLGCLIYDETTGDTRFNTSQAMPFSIARCSPRAKILLHHAGCSGRRRRAQRTGSSLVWSPRSESGG